MTLTAKTGQFRHLSGIFLLFAGIFSHAANAMAQEVTYTYNQVTPGPYTLITSLTSLGIVPFRGVDGEAFAEALAGKLLEIRLGDKPAFNVRNGDSGAAPGKVGNPAVDATFIRAAGAKLGVKGVVWGNVTSASVSSKNYTGSEQDCPGFLDLSKCHSVPVDCTSYQGNYTVTPSVFRVEDGKILYTKQIQKTSSTDVCGGKVKGSLLDIFNKKKIVVTPDAIMTAMRQEAVNAMADDIKPPASHSVTIPFKSNFPEFDAATQIQLKAALPWLKGQRDDRACDIFTRLGSGSDTKQYSLLFNIAACMEVQNNPKAALELYQAADHILQAPDKSLNAALKRLGA